MPHAAYQRGDSVRGRRFHAAAPVLRRVAKLLRRHTAARYGMPATRDFTNALRMVPKSYARQVTACSAFILRLEQCAGARPVVVRMPEIALNVLPPMRQPIGGDRRQRGRQHACCHDFTPCSPPFTIARLFSRRL